MSHAESGSDCWRDAEVRRREMHGPGSKSFGTSGVAIHPKPCGTAFEAI